MAEPAPRPAERWGVFNKITGQRVHLALILLVAFFFLQYFLWRQIGGIFYYCYEYFKAVRGTETLSAKCQYILKEQNFWERTRYNRDWWRRKTCEGDRDGKLAREWFYVGTFGWAGWKLAKDGQWKKPKVVFDVVKDETVKTPGITWRFTKMLFGKLTFGIWGLITGLILYVKNLFWWFWHSGEVRVTFEPEAFGGIFSFSSYVSTFVTWQGLIRLFGSKGYRKHFKNGSLSSLSTKIRYFSCIALLNVAVDMLRALNSAQWMTLINPSTWDPESILIFIGYLFTRASHYLKGFQFLSIGQWFSLVKGVTYGSTWFLTKYYAMATVLLLTQIWGAELIVGAKPFIMRFLIFVKDYVVWIFDGFRREFLPNILRIPGISSISSAHPENLKGVPLAVIKTCWALLKYSTKRIFNALKNLDIEFDVPDAIPGTSILTSVRDNLLVASFPIIWWVFVRRLAIKLDIGYELLVWTIAFIPLLTPFYVMGPLSTVRDEGQKTTAYVFTPQPYKKLWPRLILATLTFLNLAYFAYSDTYQESLWTQLQRVLLFNWVKRTVFGVLELFAQRRWGNLLFAYSILTVALLATHKWPSWAREALGLTGDGNEPPAPPEEVSRDPFTFEDPNTVSYNPTAQEDGPAGEEIYRPAGIEDVNRARAPGDEAPNIVVGGNPHARPDDFEDGDGFDDGDEAPVNPHPSGRDNDDDDDDDEAYFDSLPPGHDIWASLLANTGARYVPRPLTGLGSQETHTDWILEEEYELLTGSAPPADINPRRRNTPAAPPYPPSPGPHGRRGPPSPATISRLSRDNNPFLQNPTRPEAYRPERDLMAEVRAEIARQERENAAGNNPNNPPGDPTRARNDPPNTQPPAPQRGVPRRGAPRRGVPRRRGAVTPATTGRGRGTSGNPDYYLGADVRRRPDEIERGAAARRAPNNQPGDETGTRNDPIRVGNANDEEGVQETQPTRRRDRRPA